MEEGLVMTMVLVLGLAAMISTASPNQGKIFYGNSALHLVPSFCVKGIIVSKDFVAIAAHCSSLSRTTISRVADLL